MRRHLLLLLEDQVVSSSSSGVLGLGIEVKIETFLVLVVGTRDHRVLDFFEELVSVGLIGLILLSEIDLVGLAVEVSRRIVLIVQESIILSDLCKIIALEVGGISDAC